MRPARSLISSYEPTSRASLVNTSPLWVRRSSRPDRTLRRSGGRPNGATHLPPQPWRNYLTQRLWCSVFDEIEFAFRKETSALFGSIGRPVARLIVIHRRRRVPQLFYVDSGADITLIPKSVGDLLGLTLASPKKIHEIKGVGERGVPIVIRRLRLQVGSKVFPARVGWCLLEEVPLLLGRLDCFRLFEISFRHDLATAFNW